MMTREIKNILRDSGGLDEEKWSERGFNLGFK